MDTPTEREDFPVRPTHQVIADFNTSFNTKGSPEKPLPILIRSEFTQPPTQATTHAQNQVIFQLSHGANKGRFIATIERMKEHWTRGYYFPLDVHIKNELDYRIVDEFEKVNCK